MGIMFIPFGKMCWVETHKAEMHKIETHGRASLRREKQSRAFLVKKEVLE